MPSLASMRSIDPTETFQPLGPAVKPQTGTPTPLPKPTGTPGVVQLPDGKLVTELPLPASKSAAKLGEHDDYLDSLTTHLPFPQVYLCKPMEAVTLKPQALTPAQEVLERALSIAVQAENYPSDGRIWLPHTPGDIPPNGATWAVLRNGSVRKARSLISRGAGSEEGPGYAPAYDVVGWK